MARVAVTGRSGFVGGLISGILEKQGHTLVDIYLDPQRKYCLGDEVAPQDLAEFEFLIHCAHDFRLRARRIYEVNFLGSIPLLLSAHARKVPILFISSLAAHSKTKSWYGFTKLCLENSVRDLGGYSVRLGVLPLDLKGNRFASLAKGVRMLRIIFCPGNEKTYFYSTSLESLEKFIIAFLSKRLSLDKTYKIAEQCSLTYRQLFSSKMILYINIRMLQLFFTFLEIISGRSLNSDSLRSLTNQINSDEFSSLESV
jgi:hypothetical protein